MIFRLIQMVPSLYSLGFVISTKRLSAYVIAGLMAVAGLWWLVWLIPFYVWFQKPINKESLCPNCGSRDFRHSIIAGKVDRIRLFFSIHPYRCRGCTRRFFGRLAVLDNSLQTARNRFAPSPAKATAEQQPEQSQAT